MPLFALAFRMPKRRNRPIDGARRSRRFNVQTHEGVTTVKRIRAVNLLSNARSPLTSRSPHGSVMRNCSRNAVLLPMTGRILMKLIKALAMVLLGGAWLATAAHAQTTNGFRTDIETFEGQTNVLVVKGYGTAGTVSLGSSVLSIRLKQSFSPDAGGKLQALVLDCADGGGREWAVIDYAEIDSLLRAIDYIRSATYDVTSLPGFEVDYQTKGGFRVLGVGNHRQSAVQIFVQFDGYRRISLDSDQISQLRNQIAQARQTLDELKSPK
jgi:hypothetical protein